MRSTYYIRKLRRVVNGVPLTIMEKVFLDQETDLQEAESIRHSELLGLDQNDHPQYALSGSVRELADATEATFAQLREQLRTGEIDIESLSVLDQLEQQTPDDVTVEFSLANIPITESSPPPNSVLAFEPFSQTLVWRNPGDLLADIFDVEFNDIRESVTNVSDSLGGLAAQVNQNTADISTLDTTISEYPNRFDSDYIRSKLLHLTFFNDDRGVLDSGPNDLTTSHGLQWNDHSTSADMTGFYAIDVGSGGSSAEAIANDYYGFRWTVGENHPDEDEINFSMRFTMSSNADRGWVFTRVGPGYIPVAAIDTTGNFYLRGNQIGWDNAEPKFLTYDNVPDSKDGYVFTYDSGTSAVTLQFNAGSGGGGVTEHGDLTGLLDNDHPQYALTGSAVEFTVVTATTGTLVLGEGLGNPLGMTLKPDVPGTWFIGWDDTVGELYASNNMTVDGDLTISGDIINSAFTELKNHRERIVTPYDFGAVGDGLTDDTAAINAAFQYCFELNTAATPTYITGSANAVNAARLRAAEESWQVQMYGTFLVSDTIMAKAPVRGRTATLVTPESGFTGTVLQIDKGAPRDTTDYAGLNGEGFWSQFKDCTMELPSILIRRTPEYPSNGDIFPPITGVEIYNMTWSTVYFGAVHDCDTGVLLTAPINEPRGTEHNHFFLSAIKGCKIGLLLDTSYSNSGWVNENTFYGGDINAGVSTGGTRVPGIKHIWIRSKYMPDGRLLGPGKNTFVRPCLEGSREEYTILCEGANNEFWHPRIETFGFTGAQICFSGSNVDSADFRGGHQNVIRGGLAIDWMLDPENDYGFISWSGITPQQNTNQFWTSKHAVQFSTRILDKDETDGSNTADIIFGNFDSSHPFGRRMQRIMTSRSAFFQDPEGIFSADTGSLFLGGSSAAGGNMYLKTKSTDWSETGWTKVHSDQDGVRNITGSLYVNYDGENAASTIYFYDENGFINPQGALSHFLQPMRSLQTKHCASARHMQLLESMTASSNSQMAQRISGGKHRFSNSHSTMRLKSLALLLIPTSRLMPTA